VKALTAQVAAQNAAITALAKQLGKGKDVADHRRRVQDAIATATVNDVVVGRARAPAAPKPAAPAAKSDTAPRKADPHTTHHRQPPENPMSLPRLPVRGHRARTYALDLAERVVSTVPPGVPLASVVVSTPFNLSMWKAPGIGAVAAGYALVKGVFAACAATATARPSPRASEVGRRPRTGGRWSASNSPTSAAHSTGSAGTSAT
jgi:hypothetical protein